MFNSCNNSAPVEYQVNYGAHDIDSPIAIENSGGDFTASVLYGSIGMANSISCLPQFIDISHARKHQGVPHVSESIALEQMAGEAMFQQNYNCNNNYTYTSRPKLQGEYDDASECRRRASAPALFAFNPLMSSPPLVGSSDAKTSLLSSSCSSSSMNSSSSSLALSSSGLSSTVATSSPPAPGAAQFLLTQQNYAYVPTDQQQHHSQQQPFPHHPIDHLHLQQQQQQYQQQQHQHTGFASSCPHDPTPSHTPLSANGFQGLACSDSNPHQSNALAPSPCHSWNDRFASPTGPFPMNSIPAPIAWANSTPSTSLDMLYLHQQQQQLQQLQQQQEHRHLLPNDPHSFVPKQSQRRPKLRKPHQQHLHISTSPATHPLIVPNASRDDPSGMHTLFSPSYTATAGMMHPQSFTWGVVSPVESCLPSGASTPSFASQSPCLSFSATDINSNGSSRATSPLLTHQQQQQQQQQHHHHHHHHQSHPMKPNDRHATEGRPSSDPYPTKLAHSRKSSTSSIQSNTAARQRRASIARDSSAVSSSPSGPPTTASATNVSSSTTHRCPTCSQCFAGPAVLVRHVESIHKKLLWCCIGCKSNLSRRDAVTRHINLSPMESICRTVGRIGQIKTLNGTEVHCEISSYRAKPLDEVMSRMGKKISTELKKEIDRAKGMNGLSEEMLDRLVETEEGCDEDEEEEEEEEQVEEDSKADIKLEDFDEGPLKKRRWP